MADDAAHPSWYAVWCALRIPLCTCTQSLDAVAPALIPHSLHRQTQTQHRDTGRNIHTQIPNHFRTNTQAHSQGKDFTPIVASQPNATVVVETTHGDTALCGCMPALRRQLSLRPRAKALLKDLQGLNELLLSRSFLVGDAITAADVAAMASLNDPVNFFLTAAERAAVPTVMRGGFHRPRPSGVRDLRRPTTISFGCYC